MIDMFDKPKYRVQHEDGSWSDWGYLNEVIKRNEKYLAVQVSELITKRQFEQYIKDIQHNC